MRIKKGKLFWSFVVIILLLVGGEVFARYVFRLGTPYLYQTDPEIEYMLKPNQDVYRFGNHIIVNQYGMRSASFPEEKSDDERRIMIFGDSVLNGGNLTAHPDLATSILEDSLEPGEQ